MRRFFKLPLPPTSNHRLLPVKIAGRTRLVTAPKMRKWKEEVAKLLEGHDPIETEVGYRVYIDVTWPDRRRRDLDGPVKVVLDALVDAEIMVDDRWVKFIQVQDTRTEELRSHHPDAGLIVSVEAQEDWEQPF